VFGGKFEWGPKLVGRGFRTGMIFRQMQVCEVE
jgi:hypothetical protein